MVMAGSSRPSTSSPKLGRKTWMPGTRPGMTSETAMSPDLYFALSLIVKMVVTAAFLLAATITAERAGPLIGGLVATLPISAGPVYIFLALDHDDVEHDGRSKRPSHGRTRPGQHCPDRERGAETHHQRSLLREQRVDGGKDNVVGIGDEAPQRALGNKVRIVVKRKEDVDRAGADRQRCHQAADQRPGALGSDRGREQESGGHNHFDDERQREIEIGRHLARAT